MISRLSSNFASFALFGLIGCGGAANGDGTTPQSNQASGPAIARADFLAMITSAAGDQVCASPDSPLRTCFMVDEAGCRSEFQSALVACVAELGPTLPEEIPDTMEAGERYGTPIGECAGDAYLASLQAQGKLKNSPECSPTEVPASEVPATP